MSTNEKELNAVIDELDYWYDREVEFRVCSAVHAARLILAARQERDALQRQVDRLAAGKAVEGDYVTSIDNRITEVIAERDAALARVKELEIDLAAEEANAVDGANEIVRLKRLLMEKDDALTASFGRQTEFRARIAQLEAELTAEKAKGEENARFLSDDALVEELRQRALLPRAAREAFEKLAAQYEPCGSDNCDVCGSVSIDELRAALEKGES